MGCCRRQASPESWIKGRKSLKKRGPTHRQFVPATHVLVFQHMQFAFGRPCNPPPKMDRLRTTQCPNASCMQDSSRNSAVGAGGAEWIVLVFSTGGLHGPATPTSEQVARHTVTTDPTAACKVAHKPAVFCRYSFDPLQCDTRTHCQCAHTCSPFDTNHTHTTHQEQQ